MPQPERIKWEQMIHGGDATDNRCSSGCVCVCALMHYTYVESCLVIWDGQIERGEMLWWTDTGNACVKISHSSSQTYSNNIKMDHITRQRVRHMASASDQCTHVIDFKINGSPIESEWVTVQHTSCRNICRSRQALDSVWWARMTVDVAASRIRVGNY